MARNRQAKRIVFGVRFPEALRDVLSGISIYVKQRQRNWMIECLDADEFMSTLKSTLADGLVTIISPSSTADLQRVRQSGIPAVNLFHDCHPTLPSVLSDDVQIGAEAAKYLLRLGFQSFAYVGIKTDWSLARQQGFEGAIIEASYRCQISPSCHQVSDFHFMESQQAAGALRRWVKSLAKPVAVMGCSDLVVRTLLGACESAGIAVPQDVAILGVDNRVALCELARVPISSMKQDLPRIGFEAARMLDRLMDGLAAPQQPILVRPSGVVARRSTEVLVFEDEHVSAAMRLIHQRAAKGISIKELLRIVPVSRKWLDMRFKALVGHTPSREIRQLRVSHIRDLLLNTDLSIRQIARQCSFSNTENLIRFFRQAERIPPQQFRERQRK